MIKTSLMFFLIYLKMCLCWYFSKEDDNFDYEKSIQKCPWMVVIANSTAGIVSYGTLFHEKAVLTFATLNLDKYSVFNFQVFADCHFEGKRQYIDHKICSKVRDINEYNILERYQYYKHDFAVLILSDPFELSSTVNIIHIAKNLNSVYEENCIVSYFTSLLNPKTNQTGILFFPAMLINWAKISINFISKFDNVKQGDTVKILPGSPVVCQSRKKSNQWYLIAIMNQIVRPNEPSFPQRTIAISIDPKETEALPLIIENSKLPGDKTPVIIQFE